MFIEYVNKLGADLNKEFSGIDGFADLSLQYLIDYCPEDKFDYDEVMAYSKTDKAQEIKFYKNNEFGEYPITIFRNENFLIDVYVWRDQDTCIHDHNFVGSFGQMQGRSFETYYDFVKADTQPEAKGLEIGELVLKDKKILKKGDKTPIYFLDEFIHKVWHLDKLTITICIKSNIPYPKLRFYNLPGERLTFVQNERAQKVEDLIKIDSEDKISEYLNALIDDPGILAGINFRLNLFNDQKKAEFIGKKIYEILLDKYNVNLLNRDTRFDNKIKILKAY